MIRRGYARPTLTRINDKEHNCVSLDNWLMRPVRVRDGPLDTPCILWTGKRHSKYGYGMLRLNGRDVCRHRCDTRACYNPVHLVDGTQADNVRDIHERGRYKLARGRALVTEDDVRTIRKLHAKGVRQCDLARTYELDGATIWCIVHRRSWSHVN